MISDILDCAVDHPDQIFAQPHFVFNDFFLILHAFSMSLVYVNNIDPGSKAVNASGIQHPSFESQTPSLINTIKSNQYLSMTLPSKEILGIKHA
jgi:hypothetical protein